MSDSWEITDDEARESFEVVRLDDLPPTDDIELSPSETDACCYHCEADWRRIGPAAVAILRAGVDPLDRNAIVAAAKELGLDAPARGWLLTLFSTIDAIIVLRQSPRFTNGRHRVHALRAADVDECVVYTGRGERPPP